MKTSLKTEEVLEKNNSKLHIYERMVYVEDFVNYNQQYPEYKEESDESSPYDKYIDHA